MSRKEDSHQKKLENARASRGHRRTQSNSQYEFNKLQVTDKDLYEESKKHKEDFEKMIEVNQIIGANPTQQALEAQKYSQEEKKTIVDSLDQEDNDLSNVGETSLFKFGKNRLGKKRHNSDVGSASRASALFQYNSDDSQDQNASDENDDDLDSLFFAKYKKFGDQGRQTLPSCGSEGLPIIPELATDLVTSTEFGTSIFKENLFNRSLQSNSKSIANTAKRINTNHSNSPSSEFSHDFLLIPNSTPGLNLGSAAKNNMCFTQNINITPLSAISINQDIHRNDSRSQKQALMDQNLNISPIEQLQLFQQTQKAITNNHSIPLSTFKNNPNNQATLKVLKEQEQTAIFPKFSAPQIPSHTFHNRGDSCTANPISTPQSQLFCERQTISPLGSQKMSDLILRQPQSSTTQNTSNTMNNFIPKSSNLEPELKMQAKPIEKYQSHPQKINTQENKKIVSQESRCPGKYALPLDKNQDKYSEKDLKSKQNIRNNSSSNNSNNINNNNYVNYKKEAQKVKYISNDNQNQSESLSVVDQIPSSQETSRSAANSTFTKCLQKESKQAPASYSQKENKPSLEISKAKQFETKKYDESIQQFSAKHSNYNNNSNNNHKVIINSELPSGSMSQSTFEIGNENLNNQFQLAFSWLQNSQVTQKKSDSKSQQESQHQIINVSNLIEQTLSNNSQAYRHNNQTLNNNFTHNNIIQSKNYNKSNNDLSCVNSANDSSKTISPKQQIEGEDSNKAYSQVIKEFLDKTNNYASSNKSSQQISLFGTDSLKRSNVIPSKETQMPKETLESTKRGTENKNINLEGRIFMLESKLLTLKCKTDILEKKNMSLTQEINIIAEEKEQCMKENIESKQLLEQLERVTRRNEENISIIYKMFCKSQSENQILKKHKDNGSSIVFTDISCIDSLNEPPQNMIHKSEFMHKSMNPILQENHNYNNLNFSSASNRNANLKLSNNASYSKPMATSSYLPNNSKQPYNENFSFNNLLQQKNQQSHYGSNQQNLFNNVNLVNSQILQQNQGSTKTYTSQGNQANSIHPKISLHRLN